MSSFDVAMKEHGQIKHVSAFSYYYHKTSTAVHPVPQYFFTVNTVDEISSTAHPYVIYGTCTLIAVRCDADLCAENNGGCGPHANCINTPGSLTCACIEGYVGDGVNCTGDCIQLSFNFVLFTASINRNSYMLLSQKVRQRVLLRHAKCGIAIVSRPSVYP